MNKLFKISIRENIKLSNNHYLITLHPLKKIVEPRPGQFFMLSVGTTCLPDRQARFRVDTSLDPLLRRPFSLHRWFGRDFQLLYRTVGKITKILREKKPGDILEIMGPLGNGFPISGPETKKILVAGGLGIAPIFALAEAISRLSRGNAGKMPICFLGVKTKKELLCIKELKSIGINPLISTDDGTSGEKGVITNVLREFLARHSSLITHHCLYACGPKPMLRELSLLAKNFKLKGFIALEENMACGIGACLSCVANTKKGFKRVCKEGPVFSLEEIIW